jgi:hypothetical protein
MQPSKSADSTDKGARSTETLDSAPVLQYGSGPSSVFLAKILGVNTALFLFNTQFYFPLSSLLVRKSHKSRQPYVISDSSVGSELVCDVAGWLGFDSQ